MERTRAQALRELRSLLSEVLSTAAADEQVPAAFKNPQNWEHLIKRTEARLSDAWKQRFEPRKDGREPKGAALELLAEDEQEQAVLSERFVNEVLEEQAEPLEDLDQQLAAMSGVQPDPTRKNPLGPDTWADGVRSGLREIECSTDDRDWLMEQLMPLLADRVAQFYAAMSQQMGAAGFASPQRPGRTRAAPRVAAEAKPAAGAGAGGFAPEQVEARSGPAQPLLAGDGFDAGEGGAQLEHLLGLIGAQRGAGAMAGFGGDGDGDGSGGAPARPWSQADLMSVLGAMQASADGAAGALATPAGLKKAIAGTAAQLGLDGGVGAMPAQAQDTLALVSMLFEVLLDGKRLDERARSQLSRLIVPYVRVAVLDRHLFMQAMHPGRRVLNLLVEALETASQDVPQFKRLRELAFETIDTIVTGFSDDIAIFAPLEQALAAEIESSRRRAELAEKRAAEAHSGRERREHARDLVAAFLSEAMFGKRMPNALLEFLVGPWQHHQNVTLLREGEGAADVLANEALLRDLLADSDRGGFADTAAMQSRIAEVLESSGQGLDGAKELIAQLEAAFRAAKAPKRAPAPAGEGKPGSTVPLPAPEPAVVQVVVERAVLAASAAAIVPAQENKDAFLAPDTSGADMPPDLVSKYEAMPIGTWLDLVAEDGRVTSARISWTSPISGRRILSNRRGQRILVASPQELAAMELEGEIRPRHSETAFEHALHTVAKKLEAIPAPAPQSGPAQAAV